MAKFLLFRKASARQLSSVSTLCAISETPEQAMITRHKTILLHIIGYYCLFTRRDTAKIVILIENDQRKEKY